MEQTLNQPFSNVQLELLKVFSHQIPDSDLLDLKHTIALFFAKKLTKIADNVWEKENWDESKVDEILNSKLRKGK